jgi:hypothetical protein
MASEYARLAARRRQLLERSELLRSRLADDVNDASMHLRVVDRASSLLSTRTGQIVVLGGMVLLLMTGPARALRVAGRAAIAWSVARRWLPLLTGSARGRRR